MSHLAVWAALTALALRVALVLRVGRPVGLWAVYACSAAFLLCCGACHLLALWDVPLLSLLAEWATAAWATALFVLMAAAPSEALALRTADSEESQRRLAESEAEVRTLNALLHMRMQALEAFNDSVCHDLNAPLRSMEGFARAVVEDYDHIDPVLTEYLVRIGRAAARMRQLVTDLMRLSQLSGDQVHARREAFSMTDLALDVLSQERAYEENQAHLVTVEPGMDAFGDPALARLLLQNLLSNAFKFSRATPSPRIDISKEGPFFVVRDNGVGFDPSQKDRLFHPFSRLHSQADYPGTGIGLTIVKRVVDIHGGRVWAEGAPGVGAAFYFTLGLG